LKKNNFAAFLFLLAAGLFIVYMPGLNADFLLDDYGAIRPLGGWGTIDSVAEVFAYIETGIKTGPTGRPVAMLTFLMNGDTWPTSPVPFLFTNIVIHILVTVVLACFLRALFLASGFQRANCLALLAVACWALHPFQVSTVLYAVQRMTSLAALFSIAALWCYLPLRRALQRGNLKVGLIWALALGGNSLLALGSKEIAILIPQGLLLTEWLLGVGDSQMRRSSNLRTWLVICGWIPSLIVWWYLLSKGLAPGSAERRGFDVWERLITQIGVVGFYLQHLLIPKAITSGVFYDGYPVVRNFFSSPVTMVWAVVHSSLIVLAIWGRQRWPLLLFGVLWFYGWHILESTTVNLELVFEHRNYIPSMGFAIVVAWVLIELVGRRQALGYTAAALLVGVLITLLYQRASLWGSPVQRAVVWAEELPGSARAQENAFSVMYRSNNPEAGDYYLDRSLNLNPNDPYLQLKKIDRLCDSSPALPYIDWQKLYGDMRNATKDFRLYELLSLLWGRTQYGGCSFLRAQHLVGVIDAAMDNAQIINSGIAGQMTQLRGEIMLFEGDQKLAVDLFRQARHQIRDPGVAIYQAGLLASLGYMIEALEVLDELIESPSSGNFLKQQALDVRERIEKETNNG
jgi:hypothetical protein